MEERTEGRTERRERTALSPGLVRELRVFRRMLPVMGLLALALLIFGIGCFASGFAIGPQERWKRPLAAPALFGMSPKTVRFRTSDGIPIAAWWERTWVDTRSRGTVIMVHGPQDNKSSMSPLGGRLVRKGYNVLIPDLRGHGESGGKYSTFGYKEARDVTAAIAWAKANTNGEPIALFGYSSGAVSALHAAARSQDVSAVVADSAYSDIDQVLNRESDFLSRSPVASTLPWEYRIRLWLFTRPLMGRVARWGFRFRSGVPFDPPEADLVQAVRKIGKTAVLYLASDLDPVVPASDVRQLYEATASPAKDLVFQPGAHHSAFAGNPERYLTTVMTFLDRYAGSAR